MSNESRKGIVEEDCICATCGIQLSDPDTAFCVNGHDDWLERNDDMDIFVRASKNTGMSVDEIMQKRKSKKK